MGKWQLIDYRMYGGNCVKETSSAFIHCRRRKQQKEQTTVASWSEWTGFDEDYCQCGQQIQSSRYCQNTLENSKLLPISKCLDSNQSGPVDGFLKIKKCKRCSLQQDYAYNEHYYESVYDSSDYSTYNRAQTPTKTTRKDKTAQEL